MSPRRLLPLLLLPFLAPLVQARLASATGPVDPVAAEIQSCSAGSVRRGGDCIPLRSATDAEVRDYLVRQSIRAYSGNCPCPYNVDRAGRRCGGRSAYSRPGGAAPLCYASDVSDAAVRRARGQS